MCPWPGCKNAIEWKYDRDGIKGIMCLKHWKIIIEEIRRREGE